MLNMIYVASVASTFLVFVFAVQLLTGQFHGMTVLTAIVTYLFTAIIVSAIYIKYMIYHFILLHPMARQLLHR